MPGLYRVQQGQPLLLFGVSGPQHKLRKADCVKEVLQEVWLGMQVGWDRASGKKQCGVNSDIKVNSLDLASICAGLAGWREHSVKEQWHLMTTPLSLEKAVLIPAHLALSLTPVNLVPPICP